MRIQNVAVKNWEDIRGGIYTWSKTWNQPIKLDIDQSEYVVIECEDHQKSFLVKGANIEGLTCWLMCIDTFYNPSAHYQFMADRPTEICNGQNGCSTYQDDSTECEKKRNDYSNNQMLWEKY